MLKVAAVWLSVAIGPFSTYEECERAKEETDNLNVLVIQYECYGFEEKSKGGAPDWSPIPVPRGGEK